MSSDDLERKLTERPFQPFRIRLSTNSTIDVQTPGEIIMGNTSATLPLDSLSDDRGFRVVRTWRTVSIAHMVEFVDIDPPKSTSKRR
jgi:hypothetical protein